jgi:polyhydroxyalkanoate synthesis regulator phasin
MLASLATVTPRLLHEVRQTLVAVARGELNTEDAARYIAQRLIEAGKEDSERQQDSRAFAKRLLSREVVQSVREAAKEIEAARKLIVQSPAEEVLADFDGDGLSDFEERVLWGKDPYNPFTAGDTLSDAERVLLGLDPMSTSTIPVPVASPKEEWKTLPDLLAVTQVSALTAPVGGREQSTTTVTTTPPSTAPASPLSASQDEGATLSPQPVVATTTVGLVLEGRSIPNTTAWLYIFSTPIVVAVRADETGVWRYTLRRELPDGECMWPSSMPQERS